SREKEKYVNFFKLSWIISLSLGFALPTSYFLLYQLKLPLLSTIVPSRIFFLSTFSAATLAAYGMEKYLLNKSKKTLILTLFGLTIIFGIGWVFIMQQKTIPDSKFGTITSRNFVL